MVAKHRLAIFGIAILVITHRVESQKFRCHESVHGKCEGRLQQRQNNQHHKGKIPHSENQGDLNIRFSKIIFLNYTLGEELLPFHSHDYPMRGNLAEILNTETLAVSCISPSDTQLRGFDIESYIHAIGGYPSFPNKQPDTEYWNELREVIYWQELRRANANPSTVLTLPDIWSSFDLSAVADAIHSDFPGWWTVQLLQSFIKQGVRIDYDILPYRSLSDFIGLQVHMSALNTWAIDTTAPINFLIKWTVGRPRPEEVAYKIFTGSLTAADGVPEDFVSSIKSWNLNAATDFTAYPEGCPMHPSWPAMHSAAAASSFWIRVVLNLTEEQDCQAKRLDYAEAFGRTVAGAHFRSDNIAGLRLGQEVISRMLPDHLAQTYGSNATAVAEKIARLRFDWDKFQPSTCSTT